MISALQKVLSGGVLTREQAQATLARVLSGEAAPEQTGALLAAYALRDPVATELAGFASAVRALAPTGLGRSGLLDVCGTGGDGLGTFNVSTGVAFVVAACGQPVAKHGNRAVSSRCGSFDVLEALGVRTAADVAEAGVQLDRFGLSFLFAPRFHASLATVGALRRNLGVRTVFNILGPLANPVGVDRQLVGVYSPRLVEPVARALQELGATRALVVSGLDGMDEIGLEGLTRAALLESGQVRLFDIDPQALGLARPARESIVGGDASLNARLLQTALSGAPGAPADIVALNAGAALFAAGRVIDLAAGLALAREALETGRARALLARLQEAA